MTTVGVAIPSIPPRTQLLRRAFASVIHQTRTPDTISITIDHHREGATTIRNRAWQALTTDYIAFLDDDDELLPQHIEHLLAVAEEHDADLVYPGYEVIGGTDPFPQNFGAEWNPDAPCQTTITVLWRRTALEAIGGFPEVSDEYDVNGHRLGEDYLAVCALNDKGGRIVHLPERTWHWYHHFANTSGMASRW